MVSRICGRDAVCCYSYAGLHWILNYLKRHLADLTGYGYSIPENPLPPHQEIADNGQFYYPSEHQDSNSFTTDDSLEQAYVW